MHIHHICVGWRESSCQAVCSPLCITQLCANKLWTPLALLASFCCCRGCLCLDGQLIISSSSSPLRQAAALATAPQSVAMLLPAGVAYKPQHGATSTGRGWQHSQGEAVSSC